MAGLRILHVTPYYEAAWAYGGIPRVVPLLVRGLARRGHEVTVCTTDARDRASRWTARNHVRGQPGEHIRVFPNLSNRAAYHLQFFLPRGFAAFLRRNASSFDLGHLHACRNLPGVLAARHLTRAGVPYVVTPHGTAPRIERRRLLKCLFDLTLGREYLPRAARVLAVSEAEKRRLIELDVDPSRIRVVANPLVGADCPSVPSGRFRRRHGIGSRPLVLYLGRLSPRKRLEVLVQAFAELGRDDGRPPAARDCRLVIAGNDMGVAGSLRRLIHRLGIESRTLLPGLLAGDERFEALADATLVVYPGEHEVFGLVALEALLCATPVVVAGDSGCAEVIRRTGGGRIVPVGDPDALARTMLALLAEGETARSQAAAAGARVRRLFGVEAICDQLEDTYSEMLSSISQRPGRTGGA